MNSPQKPLEARHRSLENGESFCSAKYDESAGTATSARSPHPEECTIR